MDHKAVDAATSARIRYKIEGATVDAVEEAVLKHGGDKAIGVAVWATGQVTNLDRAVLWATEQAAEDVP